MKTLGFLINVYIDSWVNLRKTSGTPSGLNWAGDWET